MRMIGSPGGLRYSLAPHRSGRSVTWTRRSNARRLSDVIAAPHRASPRLKTDRPHFSGMEVPMVRALVFAFALSILFAVMFAGGGAGICGSPFAAVSDKKEQGLMLLTILAGPVACLAALGTHRTSRLLATRRAAGRRGFRCLSWKSHEVQRGLGMDICTFCVGADGGRCPGSVVPQSGAGLEASRTGLGRGHLRAHWFSARSAGISTNTGRYVRWHRRRVSRSGCRLVGCSCRRTVGWFAWRGRQRRVRVKGHGEPAPGPGLHPCNGIPAGWVKGAR